MSIITLSSWVDAKSALRNRDLRQGLYDEGVALMQTSLIHIARFQHQMLPHGVSRLGTGCTHASVKNSPPDYLKDRTKLLTMNLV